MADGGVDGRAGQFAVGQFDAVLRGGLDHASEEVGADLVAEAAGAAVNGDEDVAFADAEGLGGFGVVDFDDLLDFEVVVAGA